MARKITFHKKFSNIRLILLHLFLIISLAVSSGNGHPLTIIEDNLIAIAPEKYLVPSPDQWESINVSKLIDKNTTSCIFIPRDAFLLFSFGKTYTKSPFSYQIQGAFQGVGKVKIALSYNDSYELHITECNTSSSPFDCIIENMTMMSIFFSHTSTEGLSMCELSMKMMKEKQASSNSKNNMGVKRRKRMKWMGRVKNISLVFMSVGVSLCVFSAYMITMAKLKRQEIEKETNFWREFRAKPRATLAIVDMPAIEDDDDDTDDLGNVVKHLTTNFKSLSAVGLDKGVKVGEKTKKAKNQKKKKEKQHKRKKIQFKSEKSKKSHKRK